MNFEVDTDAFNNQLDELKEIRCALKMKTTALKDFKDGIFSHMDENDLETFVVGQHVFVKKIRSSCSWSKKKTI